MFKLEKFFYSKVQQLEKNLELIANNNYICYRDTSSESLICKI